MIIYYTVFSQNCFIQDMIYGNFLMRKIRISPVVR